jgi:hypothetical protein
MEMRPAVEGLSPHPAAGAHMRCHVHSRCAWRLASPKKNESRSVAFCLDLFLLPTYLPTYPGNLLTY